MKRNVCCVLIGLCVLCAAPVSAEEQPEQPEKLRDVAVTISPLLLILPIAEITGEIKLTPVMGAAAILGAGQVTVKSTENGVETEESFSVFEVGGQFRYYVLGDFDHGMQIGVEAMYINVSGTSSEDASISGQGTGLTLGGFIGYKVAADIGFTFDAQLGAQQGLVSAEARDKDTGETSKSSESDIIPLLNLNIGWSF